MKQPIDWANLPEALLRQEDFSSLFFDKSALDLKQKQEILKTFVLSLHSEATGVCEAINYKDHRRLPDSVDTQQILYKSADAYRYILAILNLWGLSANEFSSALSQKDDYLHYRHDLSKKNWQGEPIVLFDLDDVLAEFRVEFCDFVTKDSGVVISPDSNEYYNVSKFKQHNLSNEHYFKTFINSHGFLRLKPNKFYVDFLHKLKELGFWIQILTARPEKDLTCFYDTYSWLHRHGIPADGVAFAPEKFVWAASQNFYSKVEFFAVDDSPKHAAEYVKHGVSVIVPQKPYNNEVARLNRVCYIPEGIDPYKFTKSFIESFL